MFIKLFQRLTAALSFAILFGIAAGGLNAKALPSAQDTSTPDCEGCHQIVRNQWQHSSHNQAASDPVFVKAWEALGSPGECMQCHTTGYDETTGTWDYFGIACSTCHSPIPGDHPDEIMPTNISSQLCGDCHIETFEQWEQSTHAQEDLRCANCHNVHSTSVKGAEAETLCKSCHDSQVHFYPLTSHGGEGLLCTDCHLSISEGEMGEGHGKRTHTFVAEPTLCGECHGEDMHSPNELQNYNGVNQDRDAMISQIQAKSISSEPQNVSPTGFVIIGTLAGAAFGMLMAPWLEKIYLKMK